MSSIYVQLLFNTLQIASVYMLFASGLTLIFGALHVINFAHGALFAMMALTVAALAAPIAGILGGPTWLVYACAFAAAFVLVSLIAAAIYLGFLQRFNGDPIGGFVVTLGIGMIMELVLLEVFGGGARRVPPMLEGRIEIFGAAMAAQRFLIGILAAASAAATYFLLRYTKTGLSLFAVADDREAAALQGIPQRAVALKGFLIGSALAAIAGGLIAPVGVVVPTMGHDYLIKGFMIVILGGLGSIPGAVLASILVAAIESIFGYFIGLAWASIAVFTAVFVILIFKPSGLLGHDSH